MKKSNLSFFKALLLMTIALCLQNSSFAQTVRTVSGQITDSLGTGLPGVTVSVNDPKGNVISGTDGHYQIKAKDGTTLTFMYVGYETKTVIVNQDEINVSLSAKPNRAGTDVVVTAFV